MSNGPTPVLTDDVVVLRRWTREDAAFLAAATADPAIQRYSVPHDRNGIPVPPLSLAQAEDEIEGFDAKWLVFEQTGNPSGVTFAITDAATGEVAGMCGVDDWSMHGVAQMGYWLGPGARGRGLATRAAVLLKAWLFELGAARVFLTIVAGNEASIGVARRAGFTYEGTMRGHGIWQGERCDVLWFGAVAGE